jgi:hypothetical protein
VVLENRDGCIFEKRRNNGIERNQEGVDFPNGVV